MDNVQKYNICNRGLNISETVPNRRIEKYIFYNCGKIVESRKGIFSWNYIHFSFFIKIRSVTIIRV
jgi:hypothetical protein